MLSELGNAAGDFCADHLPSPGFQPCVSRQPGVKKRGNRFQVQAQAGRVQRAGHGSLEPLRVLLYGPELLGGGITELGVFDSTRQPPNGG